MTPVPPFFTLHMAACKFGRRLLPWVAGALLLEGCGHAYHGDGQFADYGIGASNNRYVLTLPTVDLCKKGEYAYHIGRLPSELFDARLRYPRRGMTAPEAEKVRDGLSAIGVSLKVTDEKGTLFHEYAGPLKTWGSTRQFPGNYGGSGSIERDDITWTLTGNLFGYGLEDQRNLFGIPYGTYDERVVSFSITGPLPALQPHCEAIMEIEGGGWK